MSLDWSTLLVILGMAGATYMTRVLGYWMIARMTLKGRLAAALEAVPGAVLMAVIAPTLLLAWRLPILAAVVGGVASVVALRALFGL